MNSLATFAGITPLLTHLETVALNFLIEIALRQGGIQVAV
jgi:hypothetical protein